MPPHPDTTYQPHIDGLRAVAVLSVVASHASDSLLTGGYVGVDIFFVISGYLITGILLRDQAEGRASLTTFYARRIRRIFPALILVLATTWTMGQALLFTFELPSLGRQMAAGMAFLANVALWGEAGYFDAEAVMKPLLHLWSLGIEEQFYLAWPPLIWAAGRYGRAGVITALLLLASLALNIALIRSDPTGTFYLPHTRVWELLIGAALAIREQNETSLLGKLRSPLSADAMAAAGLLLITVAIVTFARHDPFPGWRALLPTAGTALVLAAGSASTLNRLILGNPAAVFIGLISYPLYLWHWPALFTARIVTPGNPGIAIRLAAIAAAIVLATATWHFIERPIRRTASARSVAVLLVLAVATALLGVATWQGIVPSSRLEAASRRITELAPIEERRNARCPGLVTFPTHACIVEPPGRVPSIALVGDSHSGHLLDGLAGALATTRAAVVNIGSNGCVPLWTEPATHPDLLRCRKLMQPALDFALGDPRIETVMLAAAWGNRMQTLGAPAFETALRETLQRLSASGKRIVFIHDTPDLTFPPRTCFNLLRLTPAVREVDCRIERSRAEAQQTAYRRIAARVLAGVPRVEVIDPFPDFCDARFCYGVRDGAILYSDANHLSTTGSRRLTALFRDRLTLK